MPTPYGSGAIFTDAKGRPIADRPEAPGPDATTDETIAFMRAVNDYNDAITDFSNASFSKAFSKALKA